MDMNKLTQKSQEAFYDAQNLAVRYGHQEVDAENVALALIKQENGLIPRLLEKMNVPVRNIAGAIENELNRKPKVSGAGQESAKSTSRSAFRRFWCAPRTKRTASRTSIYRSSTSSSRYSTRRRAARSGKYSRPSELRRTISSKRFPKCAGNQRVTSDNPEDTYDALEKIRARPREGRAREQARPGHRTRRGDSPHNTHTEPQDEEQPRADRRAWRRQDGYSRRACDAHNARRRAGEPQGPHHLRARHGLTYRGARSSAASSRNGSRLCSTKSRRATDVSSSS